MKVVQRGVKVYTEFLALHKISQNNGAQLTVQIPAVRRNRKVPVLFLVRGAQFKRQTAEANGERSRFHTRITLFTRV